MELCEYGTMTPTTKETTNGTTVTIYHNKPDLRHEPPK